MERDDQDCRAGAPNGALLNPKSLAACADRTNASSSSNVSGTPSNTTDFVDSTERSELTAEPTPCSVITPDAKDSNASYHHRIEHERELERHRLWKKDCQDPGWRQRELFETVKRHREAKRAASAAAKLSADSSKAPTPTTPERTVIALPDAEPAAPAAAEPRREDERLAPAASAKPAAAPPPEEHPRGPHSEFAKRVADAFEFYHDSDLSGRVQAIRESGFKKEHATNAAKYQGRSIGATNDFKALAAAHMAATRRSADRKAPASSAAKTSNQISGDSSSAFSNDLAQAPSNALVEGFQEARAGQSDAPAAMQAGYKGARATNAAPTNSFLEGVAAARKDSDAPSAAAHPILADAKDAVASGYKAARDEAACPDDSSGMAHAPAHRSALVEGFENARSEHSDAKAALSLGYTYARHTDAAATRALAEGLSRWARTVADRQQDAAASSGDVKSDLAANAKATDRGESASSRPHARAGRSPLAEGFQLARGDHSDAKETVALGYKFARNTNAAITDAFSEGLAMARATKRSASAHAGRAPPADKKASAASAYKFSTLPSAADSSATASSPSRVSKKRNAFLTGFQRARSGRLDAKTAVAQGYKHARGTTSAVTDAFAEGLAMARNTKRSASAHAGSLRRPAQMADNKSALASGYKLARRSELAGMRPVEEGFRAARNNQSDVVAAVKSGFKKAIAVDASSIMPIGEEMAEAFSEGMAEARGSGASISAEAPSQRADNKCPLSSGYKAARAGAGAGDGSGMQSAATAALTGGFKEARAANATPRADVRQGADRAIDMTPDGFQRVRVDKKAMIAANSSVLRGSALADAAATPKRESEFQEMAQSREGDAKTSEASASKSARIHQEPPSRTFLKQVVQTQALADAKAVRAQTAQPEEPVESSGPIQTLPRRPYDGPTGSVAATGGSSSVRQSAKNTASSNATAAGLAEPVARARARAGTPKPSFWNMFMAGFKRARSGSF